MLKTYGALSTDLRVSFMLQTGKEIRVILLICPFYKIL